VEERDVDATLTDDRGMPGATHLGRGWTREPRRDRATHVSLLAATALGLVFVSGGVDGDVHTLVDLARPDRSVLLEASAAVLLLEVGSERTRAVAADLLHRAAHRLAGAGQPSRAAR
jgi:hypothetical protein